MGPAQRGAQVEVLVDELLQAQMVGQRGGQQERPASATRLHGVVGLAIGFGLWWLYFDFIARRPPRPAFSTNLAWVYLHLVAVTAITVIGVGVSVVIADAAQGSVSAASRHLLTGGVAVGLIAIGALETTLARRDDEPTHVRLSPALKFGPAALVSILATVDLGWTALPLLIVLLAALAIPAAYGAWVWFTQPIESARVGG